MTPARRRALLISVIAVVAAAVISLALARRDSEAPPASSARPTLLLLTSLPLVFGEDFSIRDSGSPALKALETRYHVVPISTARAAELARGRLLLMAHALGQAPEDLVTLDQWVRGGGRVLLLADPMLDWPSKRPLGDPLRPPPVFVDTGLLGHWGLRLEAPNDHGPERLELGGYPVMTSSPGALAGKCRVSADRLAARCDIGKGRAIVVADADFLDVGVLGAGASQNLNALLAELALLREE